MTIKEITEEITDLEKIIDQAQTKILKLRSERKELIISGSKFSIGDKIKVSRVNRYGIKGKIGRVTGFNVVGGALEVCTDIETGRYGDMARFIENQLELVK